MLKAKAEGWSVLKGTQRRAESEARRAQRAAKPKAERIITRVRKLADRFVLEREVGSGGRARVFLGRDEVLDRPVAVKVLKPMHGDTDIGVRFRREGRTAARLSHPNIVQVYDAGEGDLDGGEVSYIVMEYLSGGDLKERIDGQGKLPEGDLARFC